MNRELMNTVEKIKNTSDDPLLVNFYKDSDNYRLFIQALNDPYDTNIQKLDRAFKRYFKEKKKVLYISNLIKGFAQDYDKRSKKEGASLSLDRPINDSEDETVTLKDALKDGDVEEIFESALEKTVPLEDLIENECVAKAFKKLRPEQKDVLTYSIVSGLMNKEIAQALNLSEQMVSYHRKSALKQLRAALEG
ncbi:RNA polymerase sigma factor (sigma-70 family) [Virgibacillus natechei]|uniref:RNA polymerase sigma factor (Sigma-70 family) n=1 Tax=Virgibacillus natechei TaxID=1216297 RepID=A0ABS4IH95_9BACI|nr:sigma-70 family RNA polymerase sigma factor [Virgibacillus natechei]MBP1970306.1 RNA polymerase sigma factor (sigma-70 family) [Virgibacillus natechei]UZD13133.1 sigma-70 family RNA polymerase sigma factor [Virgibacillus natechei]